MPSGTPHQLKYARTVAACFTALCLNTAQAAVTYRTVALSSQQAVGTEPATIYKGFATPVINASGKTAFQGFLAEENQPSIPIGTGLWSEGTGPLELVARTGDHAPGTEPDMEFVYSAAGHVFSYLTLSAAGQVAFVGWAGETVGGSPISTGIWMGTPGQLNLVARTGDPAPGTESGTVFGRNITSASFNDNGQVAFTSNLSGDSVNNTNDSGIWSGGAGALELVAREGAPAIGTIPGAVFSSFLSSILAQNGTTVFHAFPKNAGDIHTGIWSHDASGTSLVARVGDNANIQPPEATLQGFNHVTADPLGNAVFVAFYSAPGLNGSGLYAESDGNLMPLVLTDDPAPGFEPGVVFQNLNSNHPIARNARGTTLFSASIDGPGIDSSNREGFWTHTPGALRQVIEPGQPATGTEPGVYFQGITPVINDLDQIAFMGFLGGEGITTANDQGIWIMNPGAMPVLIAREGGLFDVDPNPESQDLRTVSLIDIALNTPANRNGKSLSNAGQLAFHLTFTDGSSGIFVANLGIPGDLDHDGFVGINDLNLILTYWNQTVPPADPLADTNGDNFIGIEDLNTVLTYWNTGTPPEVQANIPEPTTGILYLSFMATLTHRRQKPLAA